MPFGNGIPIALYHGWRETVGPSMAAYTSLGAREIRTGDRTASVPLRAVTPELFGVIGVAPSLGASFSASTTASGPPPVILSHRVWQELFDQRTDAIGRVFWIDDEAHTVIGVMPERFWFSDMDSPIWTTLDPRTLAPDARLGVVVRRPAGASHAALEARLQNGLADYAQQMPAGQRQLALRASGLEGTPIGHQMSFILPYVLGTAVLLTLLIACANVAILMIAQWTAREHEIAIRASIGATRGRIVRSLLTESVLAAVCSGILGVCATFALRGWIVRNGGNIGLYDLSIDMRILLQTAVIALLTGVAAGVAPALYETRRLHTNPLRTIATSDRIRQRWRHALVVFEIAVTIALLVVTATMIDGYWRASRRQMGFRTEPLLTLDIDNRNGVRTKQVVDALTSIPGVAAASASTQIPTAAGGTRQPVAAQATGGEPVTARHGQIGQGFFATLGVPMRAGRAFSEADSSAGRTAIVNETLARQLFQNRDPVGARLWIANVPHDIVGVVADYASSPLHAALPEPRVFVPLAPDSKDVTRMTFLVRAKGDPAALVQTVRNEARKASAGTIVGRCGDRRSGDRHREPGDAGRDRAAVPAGHDRDPADDGGDLRRAGVRDRAAVARAGGARRGWRERPRRRPARHRAHRSADRGRIDARAAADVRVGARRARRRRRREHLGSGAALVRRAGGGGRRGGRRRHLDSLAARAQDRSGRAAAHAVN